MTYPTEVAREVAARRPDLDNDALRTVLTADPSLSVTAAIAILDEATYDAAFERAHDELSQIIGAHDEEMRKSITDALNNTWVEGITGEQWVADAARIIGV